MGRKGREAKKSAQLKGGSPEGDNPLARIQGGVGPEVDSGLWRLEMDACINGLTYFSVIYFAQSLASPCPCNHFEKNASDLTSFFGREQPCQIQAVIITRINASNRLDAEVMIEALGIRVWPLITVIVFFRTFVRLVHRKMARAVAG